MKILLLATLLLLLECSMSTGQTISSMGIIGKTVNEDNVPIPFVSVGLSSDASIGTYSNSSGEFKIQFTSSQSDSLRFSSIGYENIALPINALSHTKDSIKVVLHSKAYLLNEVAVTSDTALLIVKKSIEKLKENLGNDKAILQGFYREIIRSDRTYDRLVEAAVDIFDRGYSHGEMQFKIREIRKSDDFREMDWQMSILNYIRPLNGLNGKYESLFVHDYIRKNNEHYFFITNAPLNDQFFKEVTFTLDSVTFNNNDQILCIGIKPNYETELTGSNGHLYIRAKDYAILEMQFEYNAESDNLLVVPGQTFMHQTLIKYKEYNSKMYLSLLHRKALRLEINATKFDKGKEKEGLFYVESLFLTNEVITESKKAKAFKKKERQQNNIDLYTTDWKYNDAFWKNYNILIERPLEPNIKKDIERETTLDDQFKKNSH